MIHCKILFTQLDSLDLGQTLTEKSGNQKLGFNIIAELQKPQQLCLIEEGPTGIKQCCFCRMPSKEKQHCLSENAQQ